MKINEVEAQVGITRKNIRFYEEQGLLSPARNSQNGYREYGEREVETLRQIKLMRKLGVPLEEIRKMFAGEGTVADGIRRHLVTLERQQRNLEQSMQLCQTLKNQEVRLDSLDAGAILQEMEQMEQGGTMFQNEQKADVKPKSYAPAVIAAVLMCGLMLSVIFLLVWAMIVAPEGMPPIPLLLVILAVPAAVIAGVILALAQRIHEIQRGEIDEAKRY